MSEQSLENSKTYSVFEEEIVLHPQVVAEHLFCPILNTYRELNQTGRVGSARLLRMND
jgi:hypothetical protein